MGKILFEEINRSILLIQIKARKSNVCSIRLTRSWRVGVVDETLIVELLLFMKLVVILLRFISCATFKTEVNKYAGNKSAVMRKQTFVISKAARNSGEWVRSEQNHAPPPHHAVEWNYVRIVFTIC